MSDEELSINFLKSPSVHCPSPLIVFQRNSGSNSNQRPVQAFQTPMPVKTPVLAPRNSEDEIKAAINAIKNIEADVMGRFRQFEERISSQQIQRQNTFCPQQSQNSQLNRSAMCHLSSKPTFLYQPSNQPSNYQQNFQQSFSNLNISTSRVNEIEMVASALSLTPERDSGLFMSNEQLERIVETTIDQEILSVSGSIQSNLQMEMTLKRLEQSLMMFVHQTQLPPRSMWLK